MLLEEETEELKEDMMKRRILSFMLTIVLCISMLGTNTYAQSDVPTGYDAEVVFGDPTIMAANTVSAPFQDVKADDWYYDAVEYSYANGLFQGSGDGSFEPLGTMTRSMFVTVLGRMAGIDVSDYNDSTIFGDVPNGRWDTPYVMWAYHNGITEGSGSGVFSPESMVTREQLAVFLMRYFERFEIELSTNVINTAPNDLENVAPWAQDAVLNLWQKGFFTGDEKHQFNPKQSATRAEVATVSMRVNRVVTGDTDGSLTPNVGNNSGGSSGSGSTGSNTYQLKFVTNGGNALKNMTAKRGEVIKTLPIPVKNNAVFAGWYYDALLTNPVVDGVTVAGNVTLYAAYQKDEHEKNVPFAVATDVQQDFTVTIKSSEPTLTATQVAGLITYVSLSNESFPGIKVTGADGTYIVSSAAADGLFEKGSTNQLTLNDSRLTFDGQDETSDIFSFTVYAPATLELSLSQQMQYIPMTDVANITLNSNRVNSLSLPLIGGSGTDLSQVNQSEGTFDYRGIEEIRAGDTICLYEGVKPSERTLAGDYENADVAYITITEIHGSTYSYMNADSKSVIEMPDVLPVNVDDDTDGNHQDLAMTVAKENMDYSDAKFEEMGLSEDTIIEIGDFVAIYEGANVETASQVTYGEITALEDVNGSYVLTFETVTIEDIQAAMDIHVRDDIDAGENLSQSQIATIEAQIEGQAVASGFVESASEQVAGRFLASKKYSALQSEYGLRSAQSIMSIEDQVTVEDVYVDASLYTDLEEFERNGLGVELTIGCTVIVHASDEIDLNIPITMTFTQEESFGAALDGGVDMGWKWIFPYVKDVHLAASIDMYSYTGVDVNAKAGFFEVDDSEIESIDIKEILDEASSGESDDDELEDTLQAKYAEMLEYETDWVTLAEHEITDKKGYIDPFHIVAYGIEVKAVLKASLKASMGITYYNRTATRYTLRLKVLAGQATFQQTSIEPAKSEFVFYVMGEVGLRAGLNISVSLGLFSLDLNSVTLEAEAGGYVQVNGYFYYLYRAVEGMEDVTQTYGAIYLEVGIYAEAGLEAQVLSGAFTYSVPIYENKWPLWNAGEPKSVFDYDYEQGDILSEVMLYDDHRSVKLPNAMRSMRYMDLRDGEVGNEVLDYSHFDITFDNPNFRFNTTTEEVEYVPVDPLATAADTTLSIVYKTPMFTLDTNPPVRKIALKWRDLSSVKSITFLTGEGTPISPLTGREGDRLVKPTDPTLFGYNFGGWYTDNSYTTPYTWSDTMPSTNIRLYAKWDARTDIPYEVEHYKQDVANATLYSLEETEEGLGTADHYIMPSTKTYEGFTAPSLQQVQVKPDGSTVVQYYYGRNLYNLHYDSGYDASRDFVLTAKFESTLYAPVIGRTGYNFQEWYPQVPTLMPSHDANYTARWASKTEEGVYAIKYYQQNADDDLYTLIETEYDKDTPSRMVSAPVKNYEHFHLNTSYERTVQSGQVQSDNSLVLKLYYDRNTAEVTYKSEGQVIGEPTEIRYGANPTLVTSPTKDGYTFNGWYKDGQPFEVTMPDTDITLEANWLRGGTKHYTVKYYQEKSDYTDESDRWILKDSKDLTAQMDDVITVQPVDYEADHYVTPSAQELTVDEYLDDVNFYYALETYTLTVDANGGLGGFTKDYRYGQSITMPEVTRSGATLASWSVPVVATMPAKDMTYVANWQATYKVQHYLQNAEDDSYTLIKTTTESPKALGTTVSAKALTQGSQVIEESGLKDSGDSTLTYSDIMVTEDTNNNNILTGTVTDSGLVLRQYYTRRVVTVTFDANGGTGSRVDSYRYQETIAEAPTVTYETYRHTGWTPSLRTTAPADNITFKAQWTPLDAYNYKVEYYLQDLDSTDSYSLIKSENKQTLDGYSVSVTTDISATHPYAVFEGSNENNILQGTVTDDTLVLRAYYTRQRYTLTFDGNGGVGGKTETLAYGAEISEPTLSRSGYAFVSWSSEVASTMPAQDVTYTARWNKGYTVISYLQNANDNLYASIGTETLYGAVGSTVTATIKDADATKVYNANHAETILSGTLADDENLTLKVFYDRKTYTLNFEDESGTIMTDDVRENIRNGQSIASSSMPSLSVEDYNFVGWLDGESAVGTSYTMPAKNVTLKPNLVEKPKIDVVMDYYQENADWTDEDNRWEKVDTVTTAVIIGKEVTITPAKSYSHYTTPASQTFTVTAAQAEGNESITRSFNYVLDTYTLSFDGNGADTTPASQTMRYGQSLQYLPDAEKTGYVFSAWYLLEGENQSPLQITGMPAKDMQLIAQWAPETVDFTVNYFLQDADNPGTYTLQEDDTITSTAGKNGDTVIINEPGDNSSSGAANTVTFKPNSYSHFVYREDNATQLVLEYEGSDVEENESHNIINLYYDRTTYDVTYQGSGGIFDETGLSDDIIKTYRYGQTIVAPTVLKEDYTLLEWTNLPAKMGSSDITVSADYIYGVGIRTYDDLKAFRNLVNSGDTQAQSKTYVLLGDLEINDESWEPIGKSRDVSFKGTFDGNGHEIRVASSVSWGLDIKEDNKDWGLFGVIEGATIEDLELSMRFEWYTLKSRSIGSVAGYAINSQIRGISGALGNRYSIDLIGGSRNEYWDMSVGGIVGIAENTVVSQSTVIGYSAFGVVTSEGVSGGIVGLATDNSLITQCYASTAVGTHYRPPNADWVRYAGGIVGKLVNSDVDQSAFISRNIDFNEYSVGGPNAGGIVGYVFVDDNKQHGISNSYYNGEIFHSVENLEDGKPILTVGGIVGMVENTTSQDVFIRQCYTIGRMNTYAVKRPYSIGGIVGSTIGLVTVEDNFTLMEGFYADEVSSHSYGKVIENGYGRIVGAINDSDQLTLNRLYAHAGLTMNPSKELPDNPLANSIDGANLVMNPEQTSIQTTFETLGGFSSSVWTMSAMGMPILSGIDASLQNTDVPWYLKEPQE